MDSLKPNPKKTDRGEKIAPARERVQVLVLARLQHQHALPLLCVDQACVSRVDACVHGDAAEHRIHRDDVPASRDAITAPQPPAPITM